MDDRDPKPGMAFFDVTNESSNTSLLSWFSTYETEGLPETEIGSMS